MTSPDAASVVDILDQLIDIVRSARSVPMSASAMVNRSQVVELLTTARDILPDQLVEADGLLAEVDSVTARAHDEPSTTPRTSSPRRASRPHAWFPRTL